MPTRVPRRKRAANAFDLPSTPSESPESPETASDSGGPDTPEASETGKCAIEQTDRKVDLTAADGNANGLHIEVEVTV